MASGRGIDVILELMLYWMVNLSSPSEALIWGRSSPRSPPTFGAPPGDPRGPLCLCKLLFPLHAQTPSPPRCARRGLGRLQASQATPGSRQLWHSASGTMNPTGSGLDLQKHEKKGIQNAICTNKQRKMSHDVIFLYHARVSTFH